LEIGDQGKTAESQIGALKEGLSGEVVRIEE